MKFLCVKCDQPMQITETSGPDAGGSMAVVFACNACSHKIAMLTNQFETQMVSSLGVKIGNGKKSGCPFSAMLQNGSASNSPAENTDKFTWSADASARLAAIPEFVRPMVKSSIEQYAQEQGSKNIDTALLDRARESLGM